MVFSKVDEGNQNMQLTKTELKTLRGLRHKGYAVIVWNPEELGDAEPDDVEDRSIEYGHDVIETLNDMADFQREQEKDETE
jgi:hypothetical protein